ncbi:DHA2 family efflux MFS transporter permease subunit [Leucobacter denitrificans]|uniref:DHA2 family efflux MFS transporter permease subunit n=1 Tax=Leucobacter denitrificans TaxID=683042 RepID=A0A7G9S6F2_9MICO|nr:DHA2 family efflux MFS transporter permease subunit [Leucobacter denitrificans]QNN63427.1 DHA2 family efflux MFS transporter permease subunit [Leucobacter denitrificans]
MSTHPAESVSENTQESAERAFGTREKLAIWLLLGSSFVVILNETIMGLALPVLMVALDITAAEGQWLTTAFLLTMSVVIPITGMLIQRVPTRALFIAAMSLFSLGTLISAVAPGLALLILGRVVQASGTAVMLPLLMTTVVTLVPVQLRGQLMGRIAIVMSVAPALGPTIAGLILEVLSWRWLFLLVLPIAIIALVLGSLRMPNVGIRKVVRIDIVSVVLSALAFGGLVFGLSEAGAAANGEQFVEPFIPVIVGVVALVLFVWRQISLQREDRALLDLRTFRSRPYALSTVLLICSSMALFGSLILLPIYLQNVLGYKPIEAGLVLLPGGLLMGLLGPLVGRIIDAHGVRPMLIPGAFITAAALGAMGLMGESTSIWQVVGTHLLLSVGLAGVFTPVFSVSLGSLPLHLASHGSALISTVQQVAGAAGTALFVTIMTLVSVAFAGSPDAVGSSALAHGTSVAFYLGGAVACVGAVIAIFIREDEVSAAAHGGH